MSNERQVCSKERPYNWENPEHQNQKWAHPAAVETDYDSDYSIEYKCPICFKQWRVEMPD